MARIGNRLSESNRAASSGEPAGAILEVMHVGDVCCIHTADSQSIFEWHELEQGRQTVVDALGPAPLVLFDLSGVDFVNSAFLSLLLKCRKAVNARRGRMALCGLSAAATEVLRISALDTLWPVYADRDEGVTELSRGASTG